jgi:hypothetical protein
MFYRMGETRTFFGQMWIRSISMFIGHLEVRNTHIRSTIGRALPLLLLLCTGCASAIYNGGRYREVLNQNHKKDQVRAALGPPVQSEGTSAFADFDVFRVRGPVYNPHLATGASIAAAMPLGLSELLNVPKALWWSVATSGYNDVTVSYSESLHYQTHSITRTATDTSPPQRICSLACELQQPPPTLENAEQQMRVGMSGDEFGALIGPAAAGWISLLWTHYDLTGGTLSVAQDANGRVIAWESLSANTAIANEDRP